MKNIIYINALIALMLFTGCSKNDDNQSSTISQKDALIAIYNANPANTLTWDITSNNLGTWENVTINDENKVIGLNLIDKGLTNIPSEIGALTEMTFLELRSNSITSLPNSIDRLDKLSYLGLNNNQLTSLPSTIGITTLLDLSIERGYLASI